MAQRFLLSAALALSPVLALDCAWRAQRAQLQPTDTSCTRLQAKEAAVLPAKDLPQTLLQLSELTELHLSSLQLGDQRFADICKIFMLGHHESLERLYLAHNNLGAAGAMALAESLPWLPNLKVLNLPENAIRALGAEALAKALPSTPLLEQLVLAGNGIGDGGLQAVARAMPELPKLQDLHLSRNAVGTQGALALARTLYAGHGAALEWLCLSENALGDVGLQALAAGMKRTPRLEWLDLDQNGLTDLGVAALGRTLCSQQVQLNLREVTMQKNSIAAEGQRWLEAAKVQRPNLQFWIDSPTTSVLPTVPDVAVKGPETTPQTLPLTAVM